MTNQPNHMKHISNIMTELSDKKNAYVITYPRSGTHFCINAILENIKDYNYFIDHISPKFGDNLKIIHQQWSEIPQAGMVIKSHAFSDVGMSALNKSNKFIYLKRDPRDIITSYFHFLNDINFRAWNPHLPSLACDSVEKFLSSEYPYEYYYGLMAHKSSVTVAYSLFEHIYGWRTAIDMYDLDCLVIDYADLKNDYADTLKKIATHLETEVESEKLIDIKTHFSHIPRKGVVGDYKNHFNEDANTLISRALTSYENWN